MTQKSGSGREVTVLDLIPEGGYLVHISAGLLHIPTQISQALRGYWRYIQADASGFSNGRSVKK